MPFTGVSHKVGEHIDTDAIIPARFLVTTDPKKLGENCMEGLEHGWVKRVQVGDILVAERNFGCGSSREHAPIAILGAGMKAVIAHSFARIFYRNSINIGLPIMECPEAVDAISAGDTVSVDFDTGVITDETNGKVFHAEPFPPLTPFKYASLDDLKGVKGGAQTGSKPYNNCVTYCGEETTVGLAKVQDLVMELEAGKLDVVFLDYMTVLSYADAKEDLAAVDLGIPETSDGYSIAVKKGNTELAEFINGVLAELKEQNAIEQFIVEAKKLESAAE
mgnify:CR=1 FL=1